MSELKYKFMKLHFTLFFVLITFFPSLAQDKPEDTEVWEPEPVVVSPGLDNSPPSDAIVLLSEGISKWNHANGSDCQWELKNGILTVKKGTGDVFSSVTHGDIQLHLEWRAPKADPKLTGQGRGNSGVFFQTKYEIQVLDSYNNRTYSNGQAGSIYKQHIPLANVNRPPMEWQTYDIIYLAPRFNEDGSLQKPGYVTAFLNGVLVLYNVELKGTTEYIGAPKYSAHGELPLKLQDHGNPVSYRNIWFRKINIE